MHLKPKTQNSKTLHYSTLNPTGGPHSSFGEGHWVVGGDPTNLLDDLIPACGEVFLVSFAWGRELTSTFYIVIR